MQEPEDLDIPADAAALVLYADGSIAMHLPKLSDDDEESEVPDNALTIAALGGLIAKHPDRVEQLVTEFMTGQLAATAVH